MKNRLLNTDFTAMVSANPVNSFTDGADIEVASKWFVTQTSGGHTSSTVAVTRTPFVYSLLTNASGAHVPSDEPLNYLAIATSVVGTDQAASGYFWRLEGRAPISALRGKTASFSFWAKATVPCQIALIARRNHGIDGSADFKLGAWVFNLTSTWQRFGFTIPVPDIPSTVSASPNDFLGFGFYVESDAQTIKPAGLFGITGTVGEIDIAMPQWEAGNTTSYEANVAGRIVGAGAVKASQVLTTTGNAVAAETFTIGTRAYTWVSALTAAYQVLVGATGALSLQNASDAVNATPSAIGTTVGAGTAANVSASASYTSTTLTATALQSGTAGNSLVTTETMTNASWGAGTMAGGVNASIDY